jgi:hypothetical protein
MAHLCVPRQTGCQGQPVCHDEYGRLHRTAPCPVPGHRGCVHDVRRWSIIPQEDRAWCKCLMSASGLARMSLEPTPFDVTTNRGVGNSLFTTFQVTTELPAICLEPNSSVSLSNPDPNSLRGVRVFGLQLESGTSRLRKGTLCIRKKISSRRPHNHTQG